MLSSLYAGEELIAVHFLMYSDTVWHSWFPAYDHTFGRYSPGLVLLYFIIKKAMEKSVRYIDLGKGDALYKERVKTCARNVASGSIQIPSLYSTVRKLADKVVAWNDEVPATKILTNLPARAIKRQRRYSRYK